MAKVKRIVASPMKLSNFRADTIRPVSQFIVNAAPLDLAIVSGVTKHCSTCEKLTEEDAPMLESLCRAVLIHV